ncbi:MAG: amidohydrolase, partial [Deltaproteobacteria bacterium]
ALERVRARLAAPGAAGRVERDAVGAPTGVLVDPSDDLREALTVPPTASDHTRWLRAGLAACADAGLVEVHFMAATVPELEALLAIARADGRLPLRVVVYLYAGDDAFAWLESHPPGPVTPHPDVRVLGVKLFVDGALGSRGAALKAPYSDAPGERGVEVPLERLRGWAGRAAARGLQLAIHAIGDRGNAIALDLVAGAGGPPGLRHRIEHAQVVDPADWDRFVALGVVASMQPTHATSDMRWAESRLGAARLVGAYAWRTVLARPVPLAFGSDAPIESWRPALGIHAAVTRQDTAGWPPGGWRPEERLTATEAVRAYTEGAAFAAHEDARRGRIALGRPLDLTVFDADPRAEPARWSTARAAAIVRDGEVRRRPR